ncbi:hypothetical protein [Porcipelethomonas sp.]|uniref:hypothetical protein n=1 Tax=Porcipelethomonas sp. TaxID=2981675 RepID=UPI003EF997E8
MKKSLKKIAAAAAAVSIMCTAGISVSAATADDVIAAARGAGFLEEYVQVLDNYLKVNKFSSSQYDILVEKISNVGSEMDDIAMQYFGKTVAEMKGEAKVDPDTGIVDDSFLREIADKMTSEQVLSSINEIVEAGKKMGLDITVEQKAEKSFVMTVRDSEGNVQLVTPVGKLVDQTGVQDNSGNDGFIWVAALCAGMIAAGGTGAWLLSRYNKKAEE